jgi:hypothetical protein
VPPSTTQGRETSVGQGTKEITSVLQNLRHYTHERIWMDRELRAMAWVAGIAVVVGLVAHFVFGLPR